jgi:glycosyltransferase involved in cell wall biosynthesis
MNERRLVSVLTPTWQRAELLAGCIENVRGQTYRPLEHVIVVDGPGDRETARVALDALECATTADVLVRFVPLGRNWSSYLVDSFVAAPTIVGMLLASGEYQTWLADDERMEPDHIESLVTALENAGADFAYGRVRMHAVGQLPEHGYDIGADPPQLGQITNVLYRADLLKRGLYPFGAGMTSDWACIRRWIDAGATWAYTGRLTLTHRVDH